MPFFRTPHSLDSLLNSAWKSMALIYISLFLTTLISCTGNAVTADNPFSPSAIKLLDNAADADRVTSDTAGTGATTQTFRFHHIFDNHMVLQRDTTVRIFGFAPSLSATVTVSIAGQTKTTTVKSDGTWSVTLTPVSAGGPYILTAELDGITIIISDILFGDVYLCGGQSNMDYQLSFLDAVRPDIGQETVPLLRLYRMPFLKTNIAQTEMIRASGYGTWQNCSSNSARLFSGTGYYFGKYLTVNKNIPIGLIESAVSGSFAEEWTPYDVLAANSELKTVIDDYISGISKAQPSGRYNGMISPVANFSLKGTIWWQGEANVSRAAQYRTLFPAMITAWRNGFQSSSLPFIFVQLACSGGYSTNSGKSIWADLRSAQLFTWQSLPRTAMICAYDINQSIDASAPIHPEKKWIVGSRLALAADALAYGSGVEYSGPIYAGMSVENSSIRIAFTHVESGLISCDGKPLAEFYVAGIKKKFYRASATIFGSEILVSSPDVPAPLAVRYAWKQNTGSANLSSANRNMASPFRTDNW